MLMKTSDIKGFTISASDGILGTVTDFLFDEDSWTLRWIVVDAGTWLTGRKVLLPVSVLGHPDLAARSFPVRLTMAKVKASPDYDTHQPVSRQREQRMFGHYNMSPYWGSGFYMGGYGGWSAGMSEQHYGDARQRQDALAAKPNEDDLHLRSTEVVSGYNIHAIDGLIGHVSGFLIDDADWTIRFLTVDTKNWWPGKHVLVSPRSAVNILWSERLVNLDINREMVKNSPVYDPSKPVDPTIEAQMAKHYVLDPETV